VTGPPLDMEKFKATYSGSKWAGSVMRIEEAKTHYLEKLRAEWAAQHQKDVDRASRREKKSAILLAAPSHDEIKRRSASRKSRRRQGVHLVFDDDGQPVVVPQEGEVEEEEQEQEEKKPKTNKKKKVAGPEEEAEAGAAPAARRGVVVQGMFVKTQRAAAAAEAAAPLAATDGAGEEDGDTGEEWVHLEAGVEAEQGSVATLDILSLHTPPGTCKREYCQALPVVSKPISEAKKGGGGGSAGLKEMMLQAKATAGGSLGARVEEVSAESAEG
jgi:hypothetical protein